MCRECDMHWLPRWGFRERQNKAPAHFSYSLIAFSQVNGKSVALSLLATGYGVHTTFRGRYVCVRKVVPVHL